MSQSDFVTRGQALVSAGQYQEAVKVCRLGLLGRPTTVEGRVVLGQALLALRRYDEVLAEMRVALELDHTSIPAQLLKGEALLRKGDAQAAIEVLQRARIQIPTEPKLTGLLADAKRMLGRPNPTASHPAIGFINDDGEHTRNYPNHGADEEDTSDDDGGNQSIGGGYTRPTALSGPVAKKRTPAPQVEATPPPNVLAVGDRSGTVEVDPELDGVEIDGDDEFDDLAVPRSRQLPAAYGQVPARAPLGRAELGRAALGRAPLPQGRSPARAGLPAPARPKKQKADISTVELDDDEMIEVKETYLPKPGPGTAVRNAVKLPSGPLDARIPLAASQPTAHAAAVPPPPHLAHLVGNAYGAPPQPIQSATMRGNPIAAALPTMAAQQPRPPMPLGAPPMQQQMMPNPAAVRPTMAINQPDPGAPAWARSTVAAGQNQVPRAQADEPTSRPYRPEPPLSTFESSSPPAVAAQDQSSAKPLKTGMRKARSRVQIIVWFLIGGLVIGGGVFAGFQIRAMRLEKQISAAREQAITLAKSDTWKGWIGARDRLAGIAQAAATTDNRAALARTRALVAFEFGDGLPEAKVQVDALRGQNGLEIELAAAYLGLAQNDASAARASAERALAIAAEDPAALYVAGQAALLAGDAATAVKHLKAAFEREPRPLYAIALARAHGESSEWTDALAAIDKALTASSDHPGALIERGQLLAASGQISPGSARGTEVRAQLQKIVAEGTKQPSEQQRGVSPAQLAFTYLALTYIDFLRGETTTVVKAHFDAALALKYDEQRFAEQAIETLYALGDLKNARAAAADVALAEWPNSRRTRIALGRILLAQGKTGDALDIVTKISDVKELPKALAVRGQIHLAMNELELARKDFDAALKKSPKLELAVIGRAWVDLESNDLAAAKQRIEAAGKATVQSTAMATVHAAILRRGNEPGAREQAKEILEKAVNGPPGLDLAAAQLELGRIYRDLGDPRAKNLYADASKAGNLDAKLESGILMIEFSDPNGARDTLDELLRSSGERPQAMLLLETARARMLSGDHKGSEELLAEADKAPNVTRWKYDRERGRLALRKGDYNGAAISLARALESCGDDAETFLLAADLSAADEKQSKLGERVKQLAPERLKGRPELHIITGKLLFSKGEDAYKAFELAKDQLETAAPRRKAQAHLGRAIVAYNRQDDPNALAALEFTTTLDPSLYEAYLYFADILKQTDPKRALGKAQLAVKFNPDFVEAHEMVGVIAAKLGNRKLLEESITKLNNMVPNSERVRTLQKLQR